MEKNVHHIADVNNYIMFICDSYNLLNTQEYDNAGWRPRPRIAKEPATDYQYQQEKATVGFS